MLSRADERGGSKASKRDLHLLKVKRGDRDFFFLLLKQILGKCSYYHLTIKSDERDKRLAKAGQPCLSDQNL